MRATQAEVVQSSRNGGVSAAICPGPPCTSNRRPGAQNTVVAFSSGLITAGLSGGPLLSVPVPAAIAYSAGIEASRNFSE
jgi:hypothetical protein